MRKVHTSMYCALAREQGGSLMLYVSFGVFLATMMGYGTLLLLNRVNYSHASQLISLIKEKEKHFEQEPIQKTLQLEARISNIKTLLARHVASERVFGVIEKTTLPQTRFGNFTLDALKRMVSLSGEISSYTLLAHQITIFEGNPDFERVDFSGLSRGPNSNILFQLELVLKPSFFVSATSSPQ